MISAADVRALLVTGDAFLVSLFSEISRELGISIDISSAQDGIPPELSRDKYEALLIDFDCVQDAAPALAALRRSPSNRNAVIFAVASAHYQKELALEHGASFVLVRPLDGKEVRRALYTAYDAMTRERRRYFRCAAELPVLLNRTAGADLMARTSNISTTGMSIRSEGSFTLGERVGITLDLQNGQPQVVARGTVVWDDKHGKTGISFQCVRLELQRILNEWLDSQFAQMRERAVQELQNARAATPAGN